ncbi:M3 family metallopeptidase [Salinisphaera sp. P385]|uniref:oligopeptidase A n=1 Tax=Spectribacter acetivorans TaxID=3075603 RepID=A0ABU3B9W1_9GAMM|nr:M3 family metallopeptidase [Salinisphaera sp. P385]MDT0619253.1 M3 family metallopeptidase [Salinisphaera sp. P385]
MTDTNPLLNMLDGTGLPPFADIRPEHAEPAIDQLTAEARIAVEQSAAAAGHADWDHVVAPLEAAEDRLSRAFAPVRHLHSVMDSPDWRAAFDACLPKLTAFHTELGQHRGLFEAVNAIAEGDEYARLNDAQRKVVDDARRNFRLSGVALEGADRERFAEIAQRLSSLSNRFQQNLLDATQAWSRQVTKAGELAGLPQSALDLLAQNAANKELDGWLLTLDAPSFMAVNTYAENRELRREIYTAFSTRASDQGPQAGEFDNSALMEEILALRHEQAQLLGYDNYAAYSLATKMARDADEVESFLQDMARRTRPLAERELAELTEFAHERNGLDKLEAWDVGYYMDQLRQARYQLSAEDLRPYFPASRVIDGLFGVVERLYGVRIQAELGVDTWHADVTAYAIRDPDGNDRGYFYLDPYAREGKRGGAWMDECRVRRRVADTVQLPVAFLTCNFTPPVDGADARLTHDEVLTLFHEFGHGLHHLLTRIDYAEISGINGVEWDAVELPSQFMENWCWEREALDLFARHADTGKPLPDELFQRMQASRHFLAGWMMLRQVEFSLFDLRLHRDIDPAHGIDVQGTLDAVRREVCVLQPPAFNRFAHGFGHIFAGGYAAGYYSYKWAEVLSADAFAAFEETDLFDRDTGRRFLTEILERGGSRPALDSFKAFRGREPAIEPLLRQNGLVEDAA